jgi:hypothetical protein
MGTTNNLQGRLKRKARQLLLKGDVERYLRTLRVLHATMLAPAHRPA